MKNTARLSSEKSAGTTRKRKDTSKLPQNSKNKNDVNIIPNKIKKTNTADIETPNESSAVASKESPDNNKRNGKKLQASDKNSYAKVLSKTSNDKKTSSPSLKKAEKRQSTSPPPPAHSTPKHLKSSPSNEVPTFGLSKSKQSSNHPSPVTPKNGKSKRRQKPERSSLKSSDNKTSVTSETKQNQKLAGKSISQTIKEKDVKRKSGAVCPALNKDAGNFQGQAADTSGKTSVLSKSKPNPSSKDKSSSSRNIKEKDKEKKSSAFPVLSNDGKPENKVADTGDPADPMALLMMMEGKTERLAQNSPSTSSKSLSSVSPLPVSSKLLPKKVTSTVQKDGAKKQKQRRKKLEADVAKEDSGSEGMSDWEDVHDHQDTRNKPQIPDKPVEITLDLPEISNHRKKKKKEFDWKGYLQRRVKRFKKDVAMDIHKVHLLCLLSLGLRQNEELNDLTLTGQVMSILPPRLASLVSDLEGSGIERKVEALLLWYKKSFSLEHVRQCSNIRLVLASTMEQYISEGQITDARVWVLLFICILRTIGLSVRLVLSFQAVPFKVSETSDKPGPSQGKQRKTHAGLPGSTSSRQKSKPSSSSSKSSVQTSKSLSVSQRKQVSKSGASSSSTKSKSIPRRKSSDAARKHLKETEENEEDTDENTDSEDEKRQRKGKAKAKQNEKRDATPEGDNLPNSETEFEDTSSYFSSPTHLRKDLKILSNRKVLSASDTDEESTVNRSTIAGHDFWLEVYFPGRKKWICFDCFKSQFGKPYSLENSATQPLAYVVAFKNDGGIKDVTSRYAKLWMSHTRKSRTDQDWWDQTLALYNTTPHQENIIEDDEIKGQLLVRPMPTSISDFKNHPLYALRRHLLKFEAIYPDSAIPLGYIKKEPVYARECVHTLHSRDNWLKEGRLVRLAEEPYKMVKSRPKWNKPKENPDELDLELYGQWQTEKYIPPPAINGKVPKNEYGNLELFKPWMLPLGTVQLKVNGLQRVAKKLGIDVSPAMVGWDHHSGHAHPIFDGVVVCEEYADTLMAAWTEDQEIQRMRETEKREKRVYGNWKLLIRGLLIKLRLTKKFLQDGSHVDPEKDKLLHEKEEEEESFSDAAPATDVQQSWPRKQQEEVRDQRVKDIKRKFEAAQKILDKKSTQSCFSEYRGDSEEGKIGGMGKDIKIETNSNQVNKRKSNSAGDTKRSRTQTRIRQGKTAAQPAGKAKGRSGKAKSEVGVEHEDKPSASKTGRPKRGSTNAVKYFDSDEDEEAMHDSDKDQDFDVAKEMCKNDSDKRRDSPKHWLSEDGSSSDEDVDRSNSVKKCKESSNIKVGKDTWANSSKHWLDEEGTSSSEEEDFIPVE